MPRSAAATPLKACTRETQDVEEKYIIPGRVTQSQWMDMMHEEAEDIIGEIMDELMNKVMDGCLKVYAEKQASIASVMLAIFVIKLAAYSALWAKNYLTQTVEQHFLYRDEGEGPEGLTKTEDSEPMPAISDPWAQGCVPVIYTAWPSHPIFKQEDNINQVLEETDHLKQPRSTVLAQNDVIAQTIISPKPPVKDMPSPTKPVSDGTYKGRTLCPDWKKKQQNPSPSKTILGKLLPPLSCTSEKKIMKTEVETHSVSDHTIRSSISRHKEHQPMPRLDITHLPQHYITPQYEIVDSNCTKNSSKKRHKKQEPDQALTLPKPQTSYADQPPKWQRGNEVEILVKKSSPSRHRTEVMVTSGSLRLDRMVLAKGVSLSEGQATDKNSLQCSSSTRPTNLKPIRSELTLPMISVGQVVKCPPPHMTSQT